MAQPFSVAEARVTGAATTLAGDVFPLSPTSGASTSAAGEIHDLRGRAPDSQMVWFSRAGERQQTIKAPPNLYNPSICADLRYLWREAARCLADRSRARRGDADRRRHSRDLADGTQIAFTSAASRLLGESQWASTVGRGETGCSCTRANKVVTTGRATAAICVLQHQSATRTDLWMAPTSGGGAPVALLTTSFNGVPGSALARRPLDRVPSDESGQWEVYVQSFPVLGAKRAISTAAGSEPHGARRPRLFYISRTDLDGCGRGVGRDAAGHAADAALKTPIPAPGEMNARRNHYVASPDGQRFLVNAASDAQESITVLVTGRRTTAERPPRASRFDQGLEHGPRT